MTAFLWTMLGLYGMATVVKAREMADIGPELGPLRCACGLVVNIVMLVWIAILLCT